MKPAHLETLKQLALLGIAKDSKSISSSELGHILKVSQQSASNKIIELLNEGLITRDLGARKQRIKLTDKGLNILRKEYSSYQRIFEFYDKVLIRGIVTTGLGEGQYYINQKGYREQFQNKLWFKPYEGTLNLKITGNELPKLDILREAEGIVIKGFESKGRTFGDVKCFLTNIQNIDCAVVMPARSHYSDVLEVISKYHLRRTLGLKDEDVVELVISL